MKDIKTIFQEIDLWLKQQDPKVLAFLQAQPYRYHDNSILGKLKKTLKYHYIINEKQKQFKLRGLLFTNSKALYN